MALEILATADVHSPRYLKEYMSALKEVSGTPDLILWVGDMVDKNRVHALKQVLAATMREFPETSVYAVFGNEEYHEYEDQYVALYGNVRWIRDEYVVFDKRGSRCAIVGSRGALDRLTAWQRKHKPGLAEYYSELPRKIERLCALAKRSAGSVIVATHYAFTQRTLVGEPRSIWPELGCLALEKSLLRARPEIAVHAHAHRSSLTRARLDGIKVFNVSFPANDFKLVTIRLEGGASEGLMKWLA